MQNKYTALSAAQYDPKCKVNTTALTAATSFTYEERVVCVHAAAD